MNGNLTNNIHKNAPKILNLGAFLHLINGIQNQIMISPIYPFSIY